MKQDKLSQILGAGGATVMAGGVLMTLINAVFTPLLPIDAPFAKLAASSQAYVASRFGDN